MNDPGKYLLAFFVDPTASWVVKAVAGLALLASLGLVWVLLRSLSRALIAPSRRLKLRREWLALAAREGWASGFTRQLSGKRGEQAWRLAVLRSGDGVFGRRQRQANQALWQMRNLSKADRLFIVPRAEYQAKKRLVNDDAAIGDLAHFAGALAGLETRQSWADVALGWSVAGEQHAGWVHENLPVIATGDPVFQSAFVVLANNAKLAEQVINTRVDAQLLSLLADASIKPGQFIAVLIEGQFSMRCVGSVESAEMAGRFCRLGLALTSRLSSDSHRPGQATTDFRPT